MGKLPAMASRTSLSTVITHQTSLTPEVLTAGKEERILTLNCIRSCPIT